MPTTSKRALEELSSTATDESEYSEDTDSDISENDDSYDKKKDKEMLFWLILKSDRLKIKKKADKYSQKGKKKLHKFAVGDVVSVFIQEEDRGHSDMPRLPVKIIKIKERDNIPTLYTVASVYGVIEFNYCTRDLEPYDCLSSRRVCKKANQKCSSHCHSLTESKSTLVLSQ